MKKCIALSLFFVALTGIMLGCPGNSTVPISASITTYDQANNQTGYTAYAKNGVLQEYIATGKVRVQYTGPVGFISCGTDYVMDDGTKLSTETSIVKGKVKSCVIKTNVDGTETALSDTEGTKSLSAGAALAGGVIIAGIMDEAAENYKSGFVIDIGMSSDVKSATVYLETTDGTDTYLFRGHAAGSSTEGEGEGETTGLPVITSQPPSSLSAVVGTKISISFSATNATSYQWYDNNVALTEANWPGLSASSNGWNSNNLVIFSCGTMNAGDYRCVITNKYGSISTSVCTVTITSSSEGEGEGETPGNNGGRVRLDLTGSLTGTSLTGVFSNFSSRDFGTLFMGSTPVTMAAGLNLKLALFYRELDGGVRMAKYLTGTIASDGKTIIWSNLDGLTVGDIKSGWKLTLLAVEASDIWLNTGMLDVYYNNVLCSRGTDGNYLLP